MDYRDDVKDKGEDENVENEEENEDVKDEEGEKKLHTTPNLSVRASARLRYMARGSTAQQQTPATLAVFTFVHYREIQLSSC